MEEDWRCINSYAERAVPSRHRSSRRKDILFFVPVATAVSVYFPFLPHDLSRIGLFSVLIALYKSCCEHDSVVHALMRT